MSETTPHNSNPNFEPEFDILMELHYLQDEMSNVSDPIEEYSDATWNIERLNKELAGRAIRVHLEISQCGILFDGYDEIVGATTLHGGTMAVEGYVPMVNYGKLLGVAGYMVHVVQPGTTGTHPFHPDNPPVQIAHVVPVPNILSHKYLPPDYEE